jgi:hypothetical protein
MLIIPRTVCSSYFMALAISANVNPALAGNHRDDLMAIVFVFWVLFLGQSPRKYRLYNVSVSRTASTLPICSHSLFLSLG